jgi:cytochrome c biogenesis protein CcdA/thiol-disulfide isomerase/thioredoxin
MILFALAYLGGVLTIVSPCILPVLPFVFARADRPFISSGLPMLIGMAATFAAVATLAAVGGGWAVAANDSGRMAALVLLAVFGVTLLFPSLSDYMTRPLVALGGRLSQSADRSTGTGGSGILASLLLGVATGLLWAPCAGPVLGLILTGAALQGASVQTSLLLAAYAAGAATSLALALLVGGRVFVAMKKSLGVGQWVRRGLGVAVLAAVVVIGLGLDTGFLTQVSAASTASVEQGLLDRLHPPAEPAAQPGAMMAMSGGHAAPALPIEAEMPPLDGAVAWLNSPPLTREALKGKVVLVDFWTYSCINCLRSIPYVNAWAEKYKDQGLVVIGVHAPEFAFERTIGNVKKAVTDLHIGYPVAIDNEYAIWRAFGNQYWPAHYFIDATGHIRHHHFGEGEYDESERIIKQLLKEAGQTNVARGLVAVEASGAEAAADTEHTQSEETYIGSARMANFVSPGGVVRDAAHLYAPGEPDLNHWSLSGEWTVGEENASLNSHEGSVVYRFHARDLHLVLGPAAESGQVKFRITIDGKPPGDAHGADTDAAGNGVVTDQRLYQLVRQSGEIADHTFEIRFLDPGVQAFAFTFG